jgi:hypothetical protein
MNARSPEQQATVEAAISLDSAIANACAQLEGNPADHAQHAARWLRRAYAELEIAAALLDASGQRVEAVVPTPPLQPLLAAAARAQQPIFEEPAPCSTPKPPTPQNKPSETPAPSNSPSSESSA